MQFRTFGFLAAGILSAGIVQAQTYPWISKEYPDPITDSVKYFAATIGNDGEMLAVSCYEGRIDLVARLSKFDFSVSDGREVIYRIDKNPPVEDKWINDRKAVFGLIDEKAVSFVNSILDAKTLVIRSGRHTVEFTMENIKEAFSPIVENCPVLKGA